MIRIGMIGKTNTGKTTFFNAATLLRAGVSTYPFTTKRPNTGTGYVQTVCVCRELDVIKIVAAAEPASKRRT